MIEIINLRLKGPWLFKIKMLFTPIRIDDCVMNVRFICVWGCVNSINNLSIIINKLLLRLRRPNNR